MKVCIFYKSKSSGQGVNPYRAGGLATNALHTIAVLRDLGVDASIVPVENFDQIRVVCNEVRPDVAIIEAVWVTPDQVKFFLDIFPKIKLVVRAHSKIGFLQVEPEAIPLILGLIQVSESYKNFFFSSNSKEFSKSLEETYGPCLYLPNLYDTASSPKKRFSAEGEPLRIASFGATRLLKLHPTAALAALQIARRVGRNLEFYVNVDSTPGGDSVRKTMRNMFINLENDHLVETSWQDSQTFRETISAMDLVLQLSATETFCLVAADAVASGVPVVVGPAIGWIPKNYQAPVDDTSVVALVGSKVLKNPAWAVKDQQAALGEYLKDSKEVWTRFLGLKSRKTGWWK